MKKILIPTDFSKKSEEVIIFALEAFNDESCEIYFIHTYQYQNLDFDAMNLLNGGLEYLEELDLKIYEKMVNQVEKYAKIEKYKQHTFKLLCKNSEFLTGVQEAVQKFDIDIVLIGTSGDNIKTLECKEECVSLLLSEIKSCPVMAVPTNGDAWKSMGLEGIRLAS